jgi:CheY-like chemotaxis protein
MTHRILIVDDDAATRYIYRQLLNNFELEEAADGGQAIELLRQQPFDLLVLDMLLPRVQGTGVLDFIYNNPDLEHIRVIVITAHDSYRQLSLREGDVLLFKPASPQQIRQTVNSLVVSTTV